MYRFKLTPDLEASLKSSPMSQYSQYLDKIATEIKAGLQLGDPYVLLTTPRSTRDIRTTLGVLKRQLHLAFGDEGRIYHINVLTESDNSLSFIVRKHR